MSDPKHTFSVEDDGSVRIEIPSGVGVDVDARGTTTSRIIAAALRQLIAENAALLAANRDCLTHFEDMRQEYTGMAHFVADLANCILLRLNRSIHQFGEPTLVERKHGAPMDARQRKRRGVARVGKDGRI